MDTQVHMANSARWTEDSAPIWMCDNDEENDGRKMSHEILCHESYQVPHYAFRITGTTTCGTHLIPEFPGGSISDFEFALPTGRCARHAVRNVLAKIYEI